MATIKDIANRAGVSIATVSNVLNGKPGAASLEKAREIEDIARALQYYPNTLAKNLKRRRTNTIGVITEDLTVFNTPAIVDGIDELCEDEGYEIIITNMRLFQRYANDFTDTPMHRKLFEDFVRNLLSKQVEGIIYVGYHSRGISYSPAMMNVQIPFVYTYCFPNEHTWPVVLSDNELAGEQVTRHLLSLGHRNIGVISGPLVSENAQSRLRGVQKALYDARILYNAASTVYGDWSKHSGYAYTDRLLDMGATAIFAFNDQMASGVYKRCAERGVVVGKDLALFGFDDSEGCMEYAPPLSSVRMPLSDMGRCSAQVVLDIINQRAIKHEPYLLPCEILVRASAMNAIV